MARILRNYVSKVCCLPILVLVVAFVTFPTTGISLPAPAAPATTPKSGCPSVDEEIVDLTMLASSLRATKAVGPLTKLRLRGDIRNVLSRMEQWHDGKSQYSIAELQEQYDLLLMKIAVLVRDSDIALHRQLCNAWDRLWMDLENADRFNDIRQLRGF